MVCGFHFLRTKTEYLAFLGHHKKPIISREHRPGFSLYLGRPHGSRFACLETGKLKGTNLIFGTEIQLGASLQKQLPSGFIYFGVPKCIYSKLGFLYLFPLAILHGPGLQLASKFLSRELISLLTDRVIRPNDSCLTSAQALAISYLIPAAIHEVIIGSGINAVVAAFLVIFEMGQLTCIRLKHRRGRAPAGNNKLIACERQMPLRCNRGKGRCSMRLHRVVHPLTAVSPKDPPRFCLKTVNKNSHERPDTCREPNFTIPINRTTPGRPS